MFTPLSQTTFIKTDSRVVAIGDLHGDLQKTVIALKLAGVLSISTEGTPLWCGGDTIIVQLGDILDRGDHDLSRHPPRKRRGAFSKARQRIARPACTGVRVCTLLLDVQPRFRHTQLCMGCLVGPNS